MNILSHAIVVCSALAATPTFAHAVHKSAAQKGHDDFDVASGISPRIEVRTTTIVPKTSTRAWKHFLTTSGGSWEALWDMDTKVPLRIYGSGISAPDAQTNPIAAERIAEQVLQTHLALLAPGSQASDFVLVSNTVRHGVRSLGYTQTYQGSRVVGGQVSFRFKKDRLVAIGSEALPYVATHGLATSPPPRLRERAKEWILQDRGQVAEVSQIDGPMVLPIIAGSNAIEYHGVYSATVRARAPLGKWTVYMDSHTGDRVARRQILRFAEGSIAIDAPVREPLGERQTFPAQSATLSVDGNPSRTDPDGRFSWASNNPALVHVRPTSPFINVQPKVGDQAEASFVVSPDATAHWSAPKDERLDAQLSAFVHASIAKDYARKLNPDLAWLDAQQEVNVNIQDTCNAFSDGNSINFFVESAQCANTARLADVVYHEFGHSLHAQSIAEGVGAFDAAFSEGLSDYLAATITNDPKMGVGFFKEPGPLRHIDPNSREHSYPSDVGEVHYTGLIFAGAMWDLRKLLVQRLGAAEGVRLADRLFYGAVQRASSIPTTYVEVLVEDDDDGDLSNGTPNLCDINAAFGPHGLRHLAAELESLSVVAPNPDGFEVTLAMTGILSQCPGDQIAGAELTWKLREHTSQSDAIAMATAMEQDRAVFTGTIPKAAYGQVVQYSVAVTFVDGTTRLFPDNAADTQYEFYVGEVTEIYCTDFEEVDPFQSGWSHTLVSGEPGEGADDWTWGELGQSSQGGDPTIAFSGEHVVGNDLGGEGLDGLYQANKKNRLSSPVIDVSGYSGVRLQYRRWLTVEDGFFDHASIYSNNALVWQNLNSDNGDSSSVHHQDREWRFHDVPLQSTIGDNSVQIVFELASDGGLELGGWTIDDFCIVADAHAQCGDGVVSDTEECDLGAENSNVAADACRETCLAAHCGDGVIDSDEQCDDGNTNDGDTCNSACMLEGSSGDCGCTVGRASSRFRTGHKGSLVTALLFALGSWFLRRERNGTEADNH